MREQKRERRRSVNVSKNGAGQAVSMRGDQERNVANETVEIGFVGLGHMGTTMAVSLLAAGFKVLWLRASFKTCSDELSRYCGRRRRTPPQNGNELTIQGNYHLPIAKTEGRASSGA
jgi:hypothetical protein